MGIVSIFALGQCLVTCESFVSTDCEVSRSGVRLVRGAVLDVQPDKIVLSDGSEVPYRLLVWSTGVGP